MTYSARTALNSDWGFSAFAPGETKTLTVPVVDLPRSRQDPDRHAPPGKKADEARGSNDWQTAVVRQSPKYCYLGVA